MQRFNSPLHWFNESCQILPHEVGRNISVSFSTMSSTSVCTKLNALPSSFPNRLAAMSFVKAELVQPNSVVQVIGASVRKRSAGLAARSFSSISSKASPSSSLSSQSRKKTTSPFEFSAPTFSTTLSAATSWSMKPHCSSVFVRSAPPICAGSSRSRMAWNTSPCPPRENPAVEICSLGGTRRSTLMCTLTASCSSSLSATLGRPAGKQASCQIQPTSANCGSFSGSFNSSSISGARARLRSSSGQRMVHRNALLLKLWMKSIAPIRAQSSCASIAR